MDLPNYCSNHNAHVSYMHYISIKNSYEDVDLDGSSEEGDEEDEDSDENGNGNELQ